MCLIFVHLLNNDGKGMMMNQLYKPRPINALNGGRGRTRTCDLLRVKQAFRRLQMDLPPGLARLDDEMDRLITGFLLALDVPHRRVAENGNIRFELSASDRLPDGWRDGGIVAIGEARNLEDADALHLGHPLVQAAVTEARDATCTQSPVAWILDKTAPRELLAHKKKRGRLILVRIRYEGFERVDRLIPIALLEGELSPLSSDSASWLLDRQPQDRPALPKVEIESFAVEDAVEEMAFTDQVEVSGEEQAPFERNLEQLERYVEDQLLVLRRRLSAARQSLLAAQDKRESALGAELRSQAEARVRSIQEGIDAIDKEVARLETRDDADYQKWRRRVQQRRDRAPQIHRLLDVEFVLE